MPDLWLQVQVLPSSRYLSMQEASEAIGDWKMALNVFLAEKPRHVFIVPKSSLVGTEGG